MKRVKLCGRCYVISALLAIAIAVYFKPPLPSKYRALRFSLSLRCFVSSISRLAKYAALAALPFGAPFFFPPLLSSSFSNSSSSLSSFSLLSAPSSPPAPALRRRSHSTKPSSLPMTSSRNSAFSTFLPRALRTLKRSSSGLPLAFPMTATNDGPPPIIPMNVPSTALILAIFLSGTVLRCRVSSCSTLPSSSTSVLSALTSGSVSTNIAGPLRVSMSVRVAGPFTNDVPPEPSSPPPLPPPPPNRPDTLDMADDSVFSPPPSVVFRWYRTGRPVHICSAPRAASSSGFSRHGHMRPKYRS
mmetsp:Transcript_27864/g.80485  ORF Transcript_27864/g.80485 Transcript_27864/m.80485 type:complete len:301 (-) Transcript_27864:130-1032(-)